MLGMPLVKDRQLVATLLLGNTAVRHWPDNAAALVRETADRTLAALERARAKAALRERDEQNAFLVRFAVPVLLGGRLRCTLAVNQHAPRHRTPEDVALAQGIAQRCWLEVERARAKAALREIEKGLRSFGEASSDVPWIHDAGTLEWTYLSPAFERIYGLSRNEALHGDTMRNWLDLVVPGDRARARGEIEKARQGEQVTFGYRINPSLGRRGPALAQHRLPDPRRLWPHHPDRRRGSRRHRRSGHGRAAQGSGRMARKRGGGGAARGRKGWRGSRWRGGAPARLWARVDRAGPALPASGRDTL